MRFSPVLRSLIEPFTVNFCACAKQVIRLSAAMQYNVLIEIIGSLSVTLQGYHYCNFLATTRNDGLSIMIRDHLSFCRDKHLENSFQQFIHTIESGTNDNDCR